MFNFFLEKGWTREEILECPEYLAYCLMGAIGHKQDHVDLRMSDLDRTQWRMGLELKREREAKRGR